MLIVPDVGHDDLSNKAVQHTKSNAWTAYDGSHLSRSWQNVKQCYHVVPTTPTWRGSSFAKWHQAARRNADYKPQLGAQALDIFEQNTMTDKRQNMLAAFTAKPASGFWRLQNWYIMFFLNHVSLGVSREHEAGLVFGAQNWFCRLKFWKLDLSCVNSCLKNENMDWDSETSCLI